MNSGWTATTSQCGMIGRRCEHNDEGQEIERKRKHPQQRDRGDVGRDMGGDRDQEPRGYRGERDPERGVRQVGGAASAVPSVAAAAGALSGERHSSPPQAAINAISR